MNTALLVEQLTIAIVASAIVIPTIQRVKGWLPNDKILELVSVLVSAIIGFLFAWYYANYGLVASGIVAFFSVVGADAIYNLLGEKLKTFKEIKVEDEQTKRKEAWPETFKKDWPEPLEEVSEAGEDGSYHD